MEDRIENSATHSIILQEKISNARRIGNFSFSGYAVPFKNIFELLHTQAEKYADNTWCIFYPDDEERKEFSYRNFFQKVQQTANYLLQNNIQRNDRVAIISFNHSDTVIQLFAIWSIGAIAVPINAGEDDSRIAFILQNSATKLFFVREHYLPRIEALTQQSSLFEIKIVRVGNTFSSSHSHYDEFHSAIAQQKSAIVLDSPATLEDEALIVYTSGTTGNPKGVVLSQYNLLIDAKEISQWHTMEEMQTMMCVLPLHHVNGIIVTLLTPLYYGGTVVLNQKFHSSQFFERIQKENVRVVSVVPTLLQFLLQHYSTNEILPTPSLRQIICGAGPLTVELALQFEERFHIPIIHGYGLSETTCYSCFLPIDVSHEEHTHWLKDFGFPSIGVALPSNEMAIHNSEGKELAEGERGEIVMRGHNVMKYYFQNAEANENAFTFGWFRSGDEGFFNTDAQGRKYFFITGRIKELIIRGGINISPFALDEILMNIPGVASGLAVGFDNDWYGEEIGAYITLSEGSTLTESEIQLHCRKYFSFAHSPKVVVFGNEIHVTSTGKYQRNKLKHLFAQWKSVQFKEKEQ